MTELEWSQCAHPHAMLDYLTKHYRAPKRGLLSWLGLRHETDTSRQLLLFEIACCRRIEPLLIDQRSRYALAMAEKLADGSAGRRERVLAADAANAAAFDLSSPRIGVGGWLAAAQARAAEAVAAALVGGNWASVAAARVKEAVRAQARARIVTPAPAVAPPPPTPEPPPNPPSSPDFSWNSAVFISGAVAPPTPAKSAAPPAPAAPTPPPAPAIPVEEIAWNAEATIQCDYLRDIFGNPFRPVAMNRQALQKSAALPMARRAYADRAFNLLPEIANVLASEGIDQPEFLAHCRQPHEHVRGCWAIDLLLGR